MNVYLNRIDGIDDALVSMTMTNGKWNKKVDDDLRKLVLDVTNRNGFLTDDSNEEFNTKLSRMAKFGIKHITMLKFIDLSFTVKGLHRAGQDDLDAHAKRMDNRIIRMSTRTVKSMDNFSDKSKYYEDKIITTDEAVKLCSLDMPESIDINGNTYVKAINGYVREDLKDNPDVLRGLYMESIPSNCIFKVNLAEFAHIYKLRNPSTHAHPELQECIEMAAIQLEGIYPVFSREYLLKVDN